MVRERGKKKLFGRREGYRVGLGISLAIYVCWRSLATCTPSYPEIPFLPSCPYPGSLCSADTFEPDTDSLRGIS